MSQMNQQRWSALMKAMGWEPNLETFQALSLAYAEPHRHYHNQEHISATLSHLDEVRQLAEHPADIELALWFHDAIYRPFSSTNERDSAEWARAFMQDNQATGCHQARVEALIMATCHAAPVSDHDQCLMVDIDLSILGANEALYALYEQWIRKEYWWVPGFVFRQKRRALLQQFVTQKPLFNTPYFQQKYQPQALLNLTRAIARLSQ
jgi:predicted metal-dependent HD superfamily phosphohydrolase